MTSVRWVVANVHSPNAKRGTGMSHGIHKYVTFAMKGSSKNSFNINMQTWPKSSPFAFFLSSKRGHCLLRYIASSSKTRPKTKHRLFLSTNATVFGNTAGSHLLDEKRFERSQQPLSGRSVRKQMPCSPLVDGLARVKATAATPPSSRLVTVVSAAVHRMILLRGGGGCFASPRGAVFFLQSLHI